MRQAEPDRLDPEAPPPRRRRRRWVTVVLALLVLAVVAVAVLRLAGIDGNRYTVAALALTPYVTAFGLFVTLLTLVSRRRLLTFVALAASVSLGVLLLPRSLADGDQDTTGQRVRVMTANLLFGQADAAAVVALARDVRIDVLTLQELTPQAVTALDGAGIQEVLPHRVLREKAGAAGGGIFSRLPLRQIVLAEEATFVQPAAVVDLSGAHDLEVVSVHAVPPVLGGPALAEWTRDMAVLPGPSVDGRLRVLAGDFNATLDHRAFQGLLDRGYRDAAEVAGEGMRPTWSQWPFGPPVTIDHVVVDRRVRVPSVAVYPLPGSDHNAVVAELALPD